jgi:hypothetical protein
VIVGTESTGPLNSFVPGQFQGATEPHRPVDGRASSPSALSFL